MPPSPPAGTRTGSFIRVRHGHQITHGQVRQPVQQRHRPVLTGWQDPVQADPERRHVARQSKVDGFLRKSGGLTVKERQRPRLPELSSERGST